MVIVLGACTDKYVANVKVPATGYLVVEGYINVSGNTDILMSRTSGLDSPTFIPELGAHVEIESTNGFSYPLSEIGGGNYIVGDLNLDITQQYRLHIKTSNGKDYLSDISKVTVTPPIDTLTWTANSDGVTVYVTTHDNQVQPGYYQWSFEETWIYTSKYASTEEYRQDSSLFVRPDADKFYTCWNSDISTTIIIANTEKLSANVIYQFPVTLVPYNNTDKLINRYSILVKQTTLSQDWYNWTLKVKRNTEQLGSIFDAQPSETGGNIHCTTDPTETVIGFVGTTSETEKRMFIDRLDIPPTVVYSGYETCLLDTSGLDKQSLAIQFEHGNFIPTNLTYTNGFPSGIANSIPECVDCRLKGGTTIKPDFWQ
jgi:hypothetical protein